MSKQNLPLLFAAMALCISSISSADDIQDYWTFIEQFEALDRVQVDCTYTRSMTLNPSEDVYINAEARGSYRYISTENGFRVEADIVANDEQSAMLEQRGVYSFDGSIYRIFLTLFDTSEDRTTEPFAGGDFPLNPLLFPVPMLRNDLDGSQLLDIRHFQSRKLIERNIKKIRLKRDYDSNPYLSIELIPERNREYTKGIDLDYRVYMDRFDALGTTRTLPKRLELIQGQVPIATIRIDSYIEFQTVDKTVFLPKTCSFVVFEGDEAIIEYRIDNTVYSQPPTRGDLFAIKQVASQHIDTDAIINHALGTVELPEDVHERSASTQSQQTNSVDTENEQTGFPVKVVAALAVILLSLVASVALIRGRQGS